MRLEVHTGDTGIALPVRPVAEPDEVTPRPFDEPEGVPTGSRHHGRGRPAPQAELDAYEGDRRVLTRNWQRTIPRDHV